MSVAGFGRLTPAQRRVALELTHGLDAADIATKLAISPHTVQSHLTNIYRKLGTHSKLQTACYLLRGGL